VTPWTLQRLTQADFLARVDELLHVYCTAMGYPEVVGVVRRDQVREHAGRDGFRAFGALADGDGQRDTLLGFAYGYRSRPGQWWHDEVRGGLRDVDPAFTAHWLDDTFELCELHVLPRWQGAGIGRRLLRTLLDGAPGRTVVLSTPESETGEESRAWRLYRSTGFTDVLRRHVFPGDSRRFAVLGRELPVPAQLPS
jgi:ribosomal protein S18 acetylase RimI-like enzyme